MEIGIDIYFKEEDSVGYLAHWFTLSPPRVGDVVSFEVDKRHHVSSVHWKSSKDVIVWVKEEVIEETG